MKQLITEFLAVGVSSFIVTAILCHYIIPQGEMMVGVFGENIKNTLGETGGELFLSYTIDINMGLLSKNQVEISVEVVE